ncbi:MULTISPECIES: class I SAM-dependent methyltransferase [Ramlibacter]|uniref:Class I SAM-dependent methyltransferase n=1 Tax=Ramlibacter aquaticus TaxID=2780094 RepID=A0ABR9S9I3_9BURK|nr:MULTISPECIES: class I SAM-dependent methyltransferase [Ramlibacter]MBE7939013.1 class I SAM-dependent methyltransferase [Ramlibacter aquaticus]
MVADAAIEGRQEHWHSEAGVPAPRRILEVDDTLTADRAWQLASEGTGLLWRSDFHNARQLLQALSRRAERRSQPRGKSAASLTEAFHAMRMAQGQRARTLGRLLVRVEGDGHIALPRAPDLREALAEAWGPPDGRPRLVALRELQGLVGAHEWRRKGVEIPALGPAPDNRIHPHYGVFSPVRGEYLDLVARAPLPGDSLAFDIGAGTGVIAALLARRGVARVVATELHPRALACARDNIERLGLAGRVELLQADLFPPGRAPLVVCNPPWLPGRPASALEHAVYDEDSRMLRGFLAGLPGHLAPGGEGWLLMSDLAELLGLRAEGALAQWIAEAGLEVAGRDGIAPRHPKAADRSDPLHAARSRERTWLWRLRAK